MYSILGNPATQRRTEYQNALQAKPIETAIEKFLSLLDSTLKKIEAQNPKNSIFRIHESIFTNPACHGNFAIRWAARNGQLELLQAIIDLPCEFGIDPGARNNDALISATRNGHLQVVDSLLQLPANKGIKAYAQENAAIKCAAETGNLAIFSLLMEKGGPLVDPATNNNYCLKWAARHGHIEIVEALLKLDQCFGIKPDNQGNTALKWAARNGHLEVVIALLELPDWHRINPAADRNYCVKWAARNGHLEVVEELVSREPSINPAEGNNFPIRWAARHGHLAIVKFLLQLPPSFSIDASTLDNEALKWAARNNHVEIVKTLLSLPIEKGIDPTHNKHQALRWAAQMGHFAVVTTLLEHQSKANAIFKDTLALALKNATRKNHTKIKVFLELAPLINKKIKTQNRNQKNSPANEKPLSEFPTSQNELNQENQNKTLTILDVSRLAEFFAKIETRVIKNHPQAILNNAFATKSLIPSILAFKKVAVNNMDYAKWLSLVNNLNFFATPVTAKKALEFNGAIEDNIKIIFEHSFPGFLKA